MIIIGSLNEVSNKVITYDGEEVIVDKAYSIVRNQGEKKYLMNLIDLAPSENLFRFYYDKKRKFLWTQKVFDEEYVPRYIQELIDNDRAMEILTFLMSTKEVIFLGCFCENENTCHRSIIAGILYGLGVPVKSLDADVQKYEKYYEMYKKIFNKKE